MSSTQAAPSEVELTTAHAPEEVVQRAKEDATAAEERTNLVTKATVAAKLLLTPVHVSSSQPKPWKRNKQSSLP